MHENIVLDRFVLSDQASAEITGLCRTLKAMKNPGWCRFKDWMSAAVFSIFLCTASCLAATLNCSTVDVQQGVYLSHYASHKSAAIQSIG